MNPARAVNQHRAGAAVFVEALAVIMLAGVALGLAGSHQASAQAVTEWDRRTAALHEVQNLLARWRVGATVDWPEGWRIQERGLEGGLQAIEVAVPDGSVFGSLRWEARP